MKLRTLALPLFFVGGCKMSAPPTAPSDAYFGGEAAVDATAMPGSAEAPAPPMEAEEMDDGDRGGRWKRDRAARSEIASPAPAQAPQGNASTGDKAEQAVEKQPQDDLDGRHIVYTAQMIISVFNLEDAMTKAEAIPETYGGYVQSMSSGNLVLRVPSKSLRKVMDALRAGATAEEVFEATRIDPWFVDQLARNASICSLLTSCASSGATPPAVRS